MSEGLTHYYEDDLDSTAVAFGYNRNKNILIVPDINSGGFGSNGEGNNTTDKKEVSNLDKLPELLRETINNDEESQTESKAIGKVKIRNVNLNFIIQLRF
ncbi:hypothetical protein [Clostridium lundense]|uniref:hypothetical protein n=1 Tax=Clostridium lundense TaxID=319475 RepID=UPI000687E008|nr:hypothetical protein [Clostridium lundense]